MEKIAIILAGAAIVVSGAHAFLAWLAPKTKTKIDDRLLELTGKLDDVLDMLSGDDEDDE